MLWIKAFHIVAVICWFAGLFYLPRLFVYHSLSEDKVSRERFKVMERKLYRGIMTPSAIITVLLGFWLIALNPQFYMQSEWMQVKLILVVILILYHYLCWQHLQAFRDDKNTQSHVYFRWFNEFPVFLLIAIVILVVVRPF